MRTRLLLAALLAMTLPAAAVTTTLSGAVADEDWNTATKLVEKGAEVDATGPYLSTPLDHAVASKAPLEFVRLLIEKGADVNARGVSGSTPLIRAVCAGNGEAVRLLLEKGADAKARDNAGDSAITACPGMLRPEWFDALLEAAGAPPAVDDKGNPFAVAAAAAPLPVFKRFFPEAASPDLADENGVTMLMRAAGATSTDTVRFLLEKGARKDLRDNQGQSAAFYAAGGGSLEILRLVWDEKEEVNRAAKYDYTLLGKAGYRGGPEMIRFLLSKGANPNILETYSGGPVNNASGCLECLKILKAEGASLEAPGRQTALHTAAYRGAESSVQWLLEQGLDPSLRDNYGTTPAHLAASYGKTGVLKLLKSKGADLAAKDNSGTTPAINAADAGKREALEFILSKVDARKDRAGSTSILKAAAGSCRRDVLELVAEEGADLAAEKDALLLRAAEKGCVDSLQYLLSKKADPAYVEPSEGKTALMQAAYSGSVPAFKLLLNAPGADAAALDKEGRGLVHHAARGARGAGVLKLVLNSGGDARARDSQGYTPLHLAAQSAGEEVIRLLLDRGADPNAPIRTGYLAGSTPALWAASRYGLPQGFEMLKAKGIKALRNPKFDFLHAAAYYGRPAVLGFGLDSGIPVDELNSSSETALMVVHSAAGARLLLARGADPRKENTSTDSWRSKRTALHYAAAYGRMPVIKALVEAGAPLDAVTRDSHTALTLAASQGEGEAFRYLLAKGANPRAGFRDGGLACEALKGKNMGIIRAALDATKPDLESPLGGTLLACAEDAPLAAVRELLEGGARQTPEAAGALLRRWAGTRPLADLRLLVEHGYDLRHADASGNNALTAAAGAGRVENVKFLLDKGLPADSVLSNGYSPVAYAAASGSKETVDLLLSRGATLATMPRRVPPMIAAAVGRKPDMIRYLASKKADARAPDLEGNTPFFVFFAGYSYDDAVATVEALYDAGADGGARDKDGNTPLHHAAKNDSRGGMVDAFLAHRMSPGQANNKGYTPLAWALANGAVKNAKKLMDAGAKIASMEPSNGSTMMEADSRSLKLMLEAGYSPDRRGGEHHRTALIAQAGSYPDSTESMQLLLDHGASLDLTDNEGRTALARAVSNDRERKALFLISRGADVNRKDNEGRSPLHLAADSSPPSTATINALLDRGAQPNERDRRGETPLHAAVGKPAILEILARRGYILNTDNEGRTALHLAVESYSESTACMRILLDQSPSLVDYTDKKGETPLMTAVRDGDRRLPQIKLLLERKASVTARSSDGFQTPLLLLADSYNGGSSTGAARALLDAGADPNAVDKNGSSSLAWALYREGYALAGLLLERGADFETAMLWGSPLLHHLARLEKRTGIEWALGKGANIDAVDKDGRSALHVAAAAGRLDTIKYLLAKGANPNALDAAGNTPLKAAESAGQGAVLVFLRDRTAAAPVAAAPAKAAPAKAAPAAQPGVSSADLQDLVKAAVQGAMEANKPAPGAPKKAYHSDVDKPSYKSAERAEDVALVIGVERYAGDLPPAEHAERDAAAVKAHFAALGVPPRNLIHLAGERAGRAAIEKYVEQWLPNVAKPGSRVYVYFSGHGAPDVKTGNSYIVPWDGDPAYLESTAYPVARLYAKLDKLPAKEVLVAMDACFSGAAGRSVLPKGARPLVTRVAAAVPTGKVVALSASDSNEITGTLDEQGHGLFTYYLLKGLNGGAGGAGSVTSTSLYRYLKPKVQDEAGRSNRQQTPQLKGSAEMPLR